MMGIWSADAPIVQGQSVASLVLGKSAKALRAVVLRDDGRSDFGALLTQRGAGQASLVAFHLLHLNGDDP
jgi:hypothetical protein